MMDRHPVEQAFLETMRERWEARAKLDYRYFTETVNAGDPAAWDQQADYESARYLEGLDADALSDWALLEIGCGPARLLSRLAPRFDRVIGVDIAPSMLARAVELTAALPNVALIQGGGEGVPFVATVSCDMVIMHAVAIHMPIELIRTYWFEVIRVLKPGGRFRCTLNRLADASESEPDYPSEHAEGRELVHGSDYGGHSFSREAIDELFREHDFANWNVERVGATTWAVDAVRNG